MQQQNVWQLKNLPAPAPRQGRGKPDVEGGVLNGRKRRDKIEEVPLNKA